MLQVQQYLVCFFSPAPGGRWPHTRTKGKLGRELPPEWAFSPFRRRGESFSLIRSRTQVSRKKHIHQRIILIPLGFYRKIAGICHLVIRFQCGVALYCFMRDVLTLKAPLLIYATSFISVNCLISLKPSTAIPQQYKSWIKPA